MSRWIIDQNYFQDEDLRIRIDKADADDAFIITDYAFVEMFKSPQWEFISEKSLAFVSKHPERILIAKAPSELMKIELTNLQPIQNWTDIIDVSLTEDTRAYFREIADVGQTGPRHSYLTASIPAGHATLSEHHQNHEENLLRLHAGVAGIEKLLNPSSIRNLRKRLLSDEDRIKIATTIATEAVRNLLLEHGATKPQADQILKNDSFLMRYHTSFTLLALTWVERGGVNGLRADRATNELMDIDYAVFGSYCNGVLTRDHRLIDHYHLLIKAVTTFSEN